MINIELAKLNPIAVFKSPMDVLKTDELDREQKIDILRRWSYDERELQVAEEENMLPHNARQGLLEEILEALILLGIVKDLEEIPPTKHG